MTLQAMNHWDLLTRHTLAQDIAEVGWVQKQWQVASASHPQIRDWLMLQKICLGLHKMHISLYRLSHITLSGVSTDR